MRYLILLLTTTLVFLGCATPPGQLKESDLIWQEKTIPANYQEVYRRVNNGFRRCGVGVPEGNLFTDNKTGHFDVYIPQGLGLGGGSSWVLGLIDIKSISSNSAKIKAGVLNRYENQQGAQGKLWLRWASGDLTCS